MRVVAGLSIGLLGGAILGLGGAWFFDFGAWGAAGIVLAGGLLGASAGRVWPGKARPLTEKERQELRSAAAFKLYDAGWGRELGFNSFEDYLGTIPPVPDFPAGWRGRFDRTVLVDARLPLKKMCGLLEIEFLGDEDTWVDYVPEKTKHDVYWIRCQDGRKNHGRNVRDCRKAFAAYEVGLTAIEGIALFAQDRSVLDDHFPELPGSVLRRRGLVAFLRLWKEGPSIDWIPSGHTDPRFGAASRGEPG